MAKSIRRRHVGDLFAANKSIAFGRGYCDSIEQFWRIKRPPIELKNALRSAGVSKLWDEEVLVGENFMGWRLSAEAIQILDEYFGNGVSLSAVHIAYEFDVRDDVDRDAFVELLDRYTAQKYQRSTDETFRFQATHYSIDTKIRQLNGQRRPSKIVVKYHDKPGKLDGELEKPRIEIRLETPAGVKATGISRPIDLLDIKPDEIFWKSVIIRDYAERAIRATRRGTTPSPFINIDRRVRAVLRKTGRGCLLEYRRLYPRRFKKLRDRRDLLEIDSTLYYLKSRNRKSEGVLGV
ncbi:hypothetical protein GGQ85_003382 [Nitrobacter vulgaris]|nr:hypothetical protein [Nitrobacter vulgaris]MDR6305658.1 hypothetical protein [Nitrobacter vulgaris]